MKIFGLIGYPLTHSFSKRYFSEKFRKENLSAHAYLNFPLNELSVIKDLVTSNPEISGLNVTIPFKENIIFYLEELDETAREVGAVNTVHVGRNDNNIHLTGYNTDVTGFSRSLTPLLPTGLKNALILGTGGASKAVAYVLAKQNIDYLTVSRNPKDISQIPYSRIDKNILEQYLLIINTTPLGMHPDVDNCPDIPYEYLTKHHICYDLVYNPEITLFLEKSKEKGAITKNGLEMLHIQAEAAWEIWNNKKSNTL